MTTIPVAARAFALRKLLDAGLTLRLFTKGPAKDKQDVTPADFTELAAGAAYKPTLLSSRWWKLKGATASYLATCQFARANPPKGFLVTAGDGGDRCVICWGMMTGQPPTDHALPSIEVPMSLSFE